MSLSRSTTWRRGEVFILNRLIIVLVVGLALGTLLLPVSNPLAATADILLRTYLIFIGTVMAHESVHGHLGRTRNANFFWGRLALIPSMVPFTNFRETHQLHHSFTNLPDEDPDYFMKSRNKLELVLRALAMPHHWFFWLRARGKVSRADVVELLFNYLAIVAVFGLILLMVGPARLLLGMAPPLVLVSVLLWYPFAVQTHEGFSTGSSQARSHNYYGQFMYWFSLGLSMHREHHQKPILSWIELHQFVEDPPHKLALFSRDIRADSTQI